MSRFFGRGTDHLGFLNMKLRDLMGFATLAHELIQNADDAVNTTSMSFDIRTEVLVVDNDGSFSDCSHPEDSTCPWKTDSARNRCATFTGFAPSPAATNVSKKIRQELSESALPPCTN